MKRSLSTKSFSCLARLGFPAALAGVTACTSASSPDQTMGARDAGDAGALSTKDAGDAAPPEGDANASDAEGGGDGSDAAATANDASEVDAEPPHVPGTLDTTFGTNGVVQLAGIQGSGVPMVFPGGAVVASTTSGFLRLNADGSQDSSFGTRFDPSTTMREGQPLGDGFFAKVYNSSHQTNTIGQFSPLGQLTSQFDDTYHTINFSGSGEDVAAAGNQYAILTREQDTTVRFFLARYVASGAVDTTYGTAGKARLPDGDFGSGLLIQPDGRIMVYGNAGSPGGAECFVTRFATNGALDTSFGENGLHTVTIQFAGRVVAGLRKDGRIVVAGSDGTSFDVVQLTPDGKDDLTFGTGGRTRVQMVVPPGGAELAQNLAIDAQDRVLIAYSQQRGGAATRMVRLGADGTTDTSFGAQGSAELNANVAPNVTAEGIAVADDGRIVLTANASWSTSGPLVIARFWP